MKTVLSAFVAGLVFGAFVGYLVSAQQIFQKQYGLGPLFPLSFAALSLAIGSASIVNGRLVMRFGMRLLAVPYVPNRAEGLILGNREILGDQMEFLHEFVGEDSRARSKAN